MKKKNVNQHQNKTSNQQMYQLEKTPFGPMEKLRIWNDKSGNSFSIVPGHGACLLDLQIGGKAIIEGFETPGQVEANRWMKSALLAPFPNRLKRGTYEWDNKKYRFFLNDSITQNALHGFLMDQKMEVTATDLTKDHAVISCAYEYDAHVEGYPFPFLFEVTYTMKEPNSFEVKMRFQNKGSQPIPIGLGWHPYFQLDNNIDKQLLQMPASQMVGVDEFMIPTGKRYDYDEFETLKPLKSTILDNCFALSDTTKSAEVFLQNSTHCMRYWQETGKNKYNYLQVFTHPDRISIAIEPMTCNIDAFNNGDGLVVVVPREAIEVSCGVELEST